MTYTPKPIDTSNITLSNELHELIEFLAKDTHDNWSKERIHQGWGGLKETIRKKNIRA